MTKFTEQSGKAIIIEVILILGLLVALGFLINHWIKLHKEAKEEANVTELSHESAVSSNPLPSSIASASNVSDINKIKAITKNFSPQIIAEQIYNAKGVAYDNEESAISAFGELKNKVELSILTAYFLKLYEVPLMEYLTSFMNTEQLSRVATIILKLPKF